MGDNPKKGYSQIESIQAAGSSLPAASRLIVGQRDVDLLYYQHKVGTAYSVDDQKRLSAEISKRQKEDSNINLIVKILLGDAKSPSAFEAVRPAGQALVDDWYCFKFLVSSYEQRCGRMSTYRIVHRKYTGVMANLCNAGVKKEKFERAALQAFTVAP